jgi:NAD(P)-dependent dehydrogenase (short-subunit alcohol dehydrogenase family)/carbon monoxide dehydrogenase subunit G
MIRLKESILVKAPITQVFEYTSDFSHIQDWDPGVVSCVRTHPMTTGVGAAYDLVLKFGPFRPKMRYEIIDYTPFSKVVLKGEADTFNAIDTIVFTKTAHGTRIDYQADLCFPKIGRVVERILSLLMKHIGKKAMQGLERQLARPWEATYEKPWLKSGAGLTDYLADHLILPGMLMFSRYGYTLGKRFWTEPEGTLYGKTVVLTGGTSGIGKAAAFKLAEKQAHLTLIARNPAKAEQVRQEIVEKTGNPRVDFLIADLSVMKDIRDVTARLKASKKSIDILINNAGALYNKRELTFEKLEKTFATDLLGVFYLTQRLKNRLKKFSDARIINVSSGGMYTQKIDVADLQNSQGVYQGAKAYARAKRGIVILTRMWSKQLKKDGITVHSMHPGWVDTPGIAESLPGFHDMVAPILRTPEQGADTIVWLALSRQAARHTGLFWLDRRPRETVVLPGTRESAQDRHRLWQTLNATLSRMPFQ